MVDPTAAAAVWRSRPESYCNYRSILPVKTRPKLCGRDGGRWVHGSDTGDCGRCRLGDTDRHQQQDATTISLSNDGLDVRLSPLGSDGGWQYEDVSTLFEEGERAERDPASNG